jgi:hypothetical protein
MILWLVLKLEISYNRVIIIISWRILVSFRGFFFWRLIYFFAWWNIFSFHNSSFAFRYFFHVNDKATVVIDTPLVLSLKIFFPKILFFQLLVASRKLATSQVSWGLMFCWIQSAFCNWQNLIFLCLNMLILLQKVYII